MKKISVVAGIASIAATAAVLWSMPAIADDSVMHDAHDKWPGAWPGADNYTPREWSRDPASGSRQTATGTPEPGTLALFALGMGGLGLAARRRKPKG